MAEEVRGRIVLVVALATEARPLIGRFGLAPRGGAHRGEPFRVFEADAAPLTLVISGVGRVAAGSAVAYAAGVTAEPAAWLNVGMAGHRDRPLGQVVMAHRVLDPAGASWYPPLVFAPPCPTATVRTVDAPCHDYPGDELYDMEAAGFFEVATRCATRELVHCLKVVSDNRDHPASGLDAARASALMEASLDDIARVVDQLTALAGEQTRLARQPSGYNELLASARFSATRRRQLRRTLRRWDLLCGDVDPAAWVAARRLRDAGAIVAALDEYLDDRPPILSGRAAIERGAAEDAARDSRLRGAGKSSAPHPTSFIGAGGTQP